MKTFKKLSSVFTALALAASMILCSSSVVFAEETESLGAVMLGAAQNTIIGIGTVFVMLLFLSFIISLFKFIPTEEKKKAEEKAAAKAAAAAAPAPVPVVQEEYVDDNELIAVIAAAIAAAEGTSTDGFVVRSIRKINKKW
ncbi:MAG: OadG family protein [Blautia sp.]|nr:OadG family protein [Blautia sp.]